MYLFSYGNHNKFFNIAVQPCLQHMLWEKRSLVFALEMRLKTLNILSLLKLIFLSNLNIKSKTWFSEDHVKFYYWNNCSKANLIKFSGENLPTNASLVRFRAEKDSIKVDLLQILWNLSEQLFSIRPFDCCLLDYHSVRRTNFHFFQVSNSFQGIPILYDIFMADAISKHLALKVRQTCLYCFLFIYFSLPLTL